MISRIGTTEFPRIRIGIGKPSRNIEEDASDYVLANIPGKESEAIDQAILAASEAVPIIVENGTEAAMNKYNKLI